MPVWITLFIVWGIAGITTKTMKKIEPENRIYPMWVMTVSIIYTIFLILYVGMQIIY